MGSAHQTVAGDSQTANDCWKRLETEGHLETNQCLSKLNCVGFIGREVTEVDDIGVVETRMVELSMRKTKAGKNKKSQKKKGQRVEQTRYVVINEKINGADFDRYFDARTDAVCALIGLTTVHAVSAQSGR